MTGDETAHGVGDRKVSLFKNAQEEVYVTSRGEPLVEAETRLYEPKTKQHAGGIVEKVPAVVGVVEKPCPRHRPPRINARGKVRGENPEIAPIPVDEPTAGADHGETRIAFHQIDLRREAVGREIVVTA